MEWKTTRISHPVKCGTVYLAGPLTGVSYKEAVEWRSKAISQFSQVGIQAFSPIKQKEAFRGKARIPYMLEGETEAGLTARDRFYCTKSDLILMNLLGAVKVSIGTMIEVGWADAARIPIVLIMEEGNIHSHPILRRVASFLVPSVDEGIETVKSILLL